MTVRRPRGQVVRDASGFAFIPDRLEAAPLLAWSGWSRWSKHFQELVKDKYQSPTAHARAPPWLNLRKSLSHPDHPDQPSVYAGSSGPSIKTDPGPAPLYPGPTTNKQ